MDKWSTSVFWILVLWIPSFTFGQGGHLTVTVKDIEVGVGKIYVALYDSPANFLKKYAYSESASADATTKDISFFNLREGEYAISVIHDQNENGELDKNFFGIPKEGFGFLNGMMGRFGPPGFDQVKITWTGESQKVIVPLKYY